MNKRVKLLTYTAMFAVLNYAVFTFGKINIPISEGSTTAIHVANAVVVLSGWFLGPIYGGLAGAIGLSIADFLDPRYIASAPKTFFLKFMIAFLAGTAAKKLGMTTENDRHRLIVSASFSAALGLGFNVIFDPVIGYLYKRYILRVPAEAASIILAWSAGVTMFNAAVCLILSVVLYLALYKTMRGRIPYGK
ncbi:MAG: ECF transporter S component [Erysipelotrichales bacterium]|nr:ECF transporter S component [Erysipelotrichales bacterium]MBQ1385964.1 ECF transporter S component [Erysipelotrichales bacterium]MBQ2479091.1 ECF transporter S component [Erysipelotrichales bacterium]